MSRRTWWLHYTLPLWALSLLAGVADGVLGYPGLAPAEPPYDLYEWTGGPLGLLVGVFFLIPSVASTVSRLHDRGHSAWWLLWGLVPLVGAVVLFVQVGCLRGDGGPNRYGPPEGQPVQSEGAGLDTWA
jgi:uncharacterized membrane protein YhaH (DUF805 family)